MGTIVYNSQNKGKTADKDHAPSQSQKALFGTLS